jgi:DNA repair protein RecN (Recombination protein N)
MCAITGETGAGKSVLVGAITLLFADNNHSIEAFDSEKPIYLEASFDISLNSEALHYLKELGYEDDEFVVAREISPKGKSQYFIYGRKVAAAILKDLKPLLVDFHHQRDQQKLLSTTYQLEILDCFGDLGAIVDQHKSLYHALKKDLRKLKELRRQDELNKQMAELYTFQFNELENARLKLCEDNDLQNEYELLSAANEISELSGSLAGTLFEAESSTYDQLSKSLAQVSKFADLHPNLGEITQHLGSALDSVEQAANLLRYMPEQISSDPARLDQISSRLDYINELKHKHKVPDITSLIQKQSKLGELVAGFSSLEQEIKALEISLEKQYQELLALTTSLSERRASTAAELCQEMERNIRSLSIPEGRFEIRIDKINIDKNDRHKFLGALSERGQDSVEFYFCANPGSAIKPLTAVASGGELSRILLAIKKVLAQNISPKLMILDEIDAGIGGKTAELIAQYIKEISHTHSVMCITHLAQLAVVADQHISLSKTSESDKTIVHLSILDKVARRNEIARMLSGNITEHSLKHAEELLDK